MERAKTASMEDYLEAIAVLRGKGKVVRVKQISRALGVKMPSVTSAMRKLSEEGLVKHERYGYMELTAEGNRAANSGRRSRGFLFGRRPPRETVSVPGARAGHSRHRYHLQVHGN